MFGYLSGDFTAVSSSLGKTKLQPSQLPSQRGGLEEGWGGGLPDTENLERKLEVKGLQALSLWGASPAADKEPKKPLTVRFSNLREQVLEFPWQLLQVEGRRCQILELLGFHRPAWLIPRC